MIASLVIQQTPEATLALVSFIVVGVLASAVWLWWLWYTLWEWPCGHSPRECDCDRTPH